MFTFNEVIWLDVTGHMTPKTRRLHINKPSFFNVKLALPGMGVGTGGAQGARAPPNNFAKWNFPYSVCTLIKEIGT